MTRRTPAQYDFARQLFDELLLVNLIGARRQTSPRRGKVKHIDIHHMTVKDSTDGAANRTCVQIWKSREASAHYGIDNDHVAQFVYDNAEAWGNANGQANREGIIIEHANSTLGPKWEVSDKTIATSVRVVAGLHATHRLGRPTSTGFGMAGTIRTHQSFYSTSCPGPYFKKIWASYVKRVQAEYDRITKNPAPVPTPAPQPASAGGVSVTSASLNAGSYNAHGAVTYKTRTDRYAKRRLGSHVDVLNLQEVGNGPNRKSAPNCYMRGRLQKALGGVYRRHIGSDGRYCFSNTTRLKPIKSGAITAAKSTWYLKDDKQGSYLVYEKNGVRAMDVSIHLEHRSGAVADAKRVAQMLSIVAQTLAIASKYGVDIRNILFAGDTNSEGMVAAAMLTAGWRNVATGTPFETTSTFIGWDGKARKRFDYAFVHVTAGAADVNAVHADPKISDHAELVVRRQLTA